MTAVVGAKLAEQTRHQIAVRLLPLLFIFYIISYLDRSSVAYAAIGMSRTLGFSDRVFGLGAGSHRTGPDQQGRKSLQKRAMARSCTPRRKKGKWGDRRLSWCRKTPR